MAIQIGSVVRTWDGLEWEYLGATRGFESRTPEALLGVVLMAREILDHRVAELEARVAAKAAGQ